MSSTPFPPEHVDALLAAESMQDRATVLRSAGLLDASGLTALLTHAQGMLPKDPAISRRLAITCGALADEAGAGDILPPALYLQAQTHALNGEFADARQLIENAQTAYQRLGNDREALRTNLGLMHILGESGSHGEAVATGQRMLEMLANWEETTEQAVLVARVQTNLGICYGQMGRYEEALAAYAVAEARYSALGMDERTANVSNNRGVALMYLGRVREALALFEHAASLRARAELPFLQAQSLANLGESHLLLGNYNQALTNLEEARRLLQAFPTAADLLIITRKMADTYLALNLSSEAIDLYRQAEELARTLQMPHQHGWVLWGLGAGLIHKFQFEEAETVLRQAAALLVAANNRPLLSSVRLEEAALLSARGEREAALRLAAEAQTLVADSPWHVQQIYAALRLADLSWPDLAAVESSLHAVAALVAQLDLPHLRYRLAGRLGRLRLAQGKSDEAEIQLQAAISSIETMRGTLAQEALRTSFLQDKLAAYEDLLRLYLERGDSTHWEQAFTVAEQARSRVLVDLLRGAVQGRLDADDELNERLAGLRADLDALYNQLLEGGEGEARSGVSPAQTSLLEAEISRLRLHAATGAAPSTKVQLSTPVRLLERIPASVPLVTYYILDDEICAFIVERQRVQVIRHLASAAAVQSLVQRLGIQWERFRAGPYLAQQHLARLEQSVQRLLNELYQRLWAPLEQSFAHQSSPASVVVIPHGVLHQVPFHALHDGSDYLIARYAISYAPSATVYAHCQERPRQSRQRALVLSSADAHTPFVSLEAQRVAAVFPNVDLLDGGNATTVALRAVLPGPNVVHLACHGLFRADNPGFSALKLEDGWLTALDLLDYDFCGSLVVLSACESGRSRPLPGDELLGLPRALIGAGAKTVVVSQWLVQDEAAADLMAHFYQELSSGHSPTAALRSAQMALRQQHSHPYYWAPFVVMGAR